MDGRRTRLVGLLLLGLAGCGISSEGPTGGVEGGDPLGLVIQDLQTSEITDTTAVVTWTTTLTAVGTLQYGTTSDLTNTQTLTSALGNQHQVDLTDLVPSTLYYYRVTATDTQGDTASETGDPFQTLVASDVNDSTPPVIYDIEVIGVTSSSAEIHWKTDDRCRGKVYYDLDVPLGFMQDEPDSYTRQHEMILTGLQDNQTYKYAIEETNMASLTSTATEGLEFTTLPKPTLHFCPDTLEIAEGADFEMIVCIEDARDLHGIAMLIRFDPLLADLADTSAIEPGPFLEPGGSTHTQFFMKDTWPTHGEVLIEGSWEVEFNGDGDTRLGSWADGDGELARIRGRLREGVTECPVQFISLAEGRGETKLVDYHLLPVSFHAVDGLIRVAR